MSGKVQRMDLVEAFWIAWSSKAGLRTLSTVAADSDKTREKLLD